MVISDFDCALKNNMEIVIWGYGRFLGEKYNEVFEQIDVSAICDNDCNKWGKEFYELNIPCSKPDEILHKKNIFVVVSVQNIGAFNEIKKLLEKENIDFCHINDILRKAQDKWEQREIEKYDLKMQMVEEPDALDKMKMFVSISVPIESCNLSCEYCYIAHNHTFQRKEIIYHSPQFIRRALSRKRLNGTALINFCGVGETLLCKELVPIVTELLEEGHYISIITNALLTEPLNNLLTINQEYNERIFIKCSFHYRELLSKRMLQRFVANVNSIRESGASYTIELVPEDEIIPMIDEIIDFSSKNFGALPHLTVTRDERVQELPLLTRLSEEEYKKIWGKFKSEMFEIKMDNRDVQNKFCYAGERAILFSLESGEFSACPFHASVGNIYQNIDEKIDFVPIGNECKLPYCFNGHAYLTLGLVPDISTYSYYQIRNREMDNGQNWVSKKMEDFLKQRICDNY